MKTRIIYTRFWQDSYICSLNYKEKLAFIYFLTNDRVNICGIYEIPDRYIMIDLNINAEELQTIKEKLQGDNKIIFYKGWVKIINYDKYNKYLGAKNEEAKKKELLYVPECLKDEYPIDTVSIGNRNGIDTTNNHNHNHNHIGYPIDTVSKKRALEELREKAKKIGKK